VLTTVAIFVLPIQLDLTCNHIGPDGALAFGFALTRNKTLQRLVLRQNLIGDDGCAAICGALEMANNTLIALSLAANGLSLEATKAIGRVIAANTPLTEIDLSSNDFGEVYSIS